VGGSEVIEVDVRIIAATNHNLMQAVKEGRFREDLYYRLNVIQIQVPPLRERREDILVLAQSFLERYCGSQGKSLDEKAKSALLAYEWPGNIRELKNIMERLAIIVAGETIGLSDLPGEVQSPEGVTGEGISVAGTMEDIERQAIFSALKKSGGVKSEAAKALNIGLKTLYRKLEKYQEEGHDLDFLKS